MSDSTAFSLTLTIWNGDGELWYILWNMMKKINQLLQAFEAANIHPDFPIHDVLWKSKDWCLAWLHIAIENDMGRMSCRNWEQCYCVITKTALFFGVGSIWWEIFKHLTWVLWTTSLRSELELKNSMDPLRNVFPSQSYSILPTDTGNLNFGMCSFRRKNIWISYLGTMLIPLSTKTLRWQRLWSSRIGLIKQLAG